MEINNVLQLLSKHETGTFLDLVEFNGKKLGTCDIKGVSPVWEMHPDTDELFYVIEGQMEVTLLEDNGPSEYQASAGSMFVVPKGIWHRPGAESGAKFIYFTPGQTLHSEAADPRTEQK